MITYLKSLNGFELWALIIVVSWCALATSVILVEICSGLVYRARRFVEGGYSYLRGKRGKAESEGRRRFKGLRAFRLNARNRADLMQLLREGSYIEVDSDLHSIAAERLGEAVALTYRHASPGARSELVQDCSVFLRKYPILREGSSDESVRSLVGN